ncbi:putative odorant receptor 92a [Wyeomyia smithii]|uniref:putative odorant receptor 92a n=1 Tax=Wyeomyia smithii TaxID=174621 RepID=UPI002467CA7A|nr:putative odorant receptor 92a [Wyeomyia smithii]
MEVVGRLERYRIFRPKDPNAEPVYRDAMARIDWFNAFIGISMFEKYVNLINFRYLYGAATLTVFFYFVCETTYYYRDNVENILMSVTTVGFAVQMVSKQYTYAFKRKRIVDIHEMNLEYLNFDVIQDPAIQLAIRKSAILSHILIKMTLVGYLVLVILIATVPVILGFMMGEVLLPFGFEVIHSTSWTAFWINYGFQLSCTYFTGLVSSSSDALFILNVFTACEQIDAILALLAELNLMARSNMPEQLLSDQLTKILRLHQHHQQYIRKLENVFDCYFLIAIAMLCFCMSLSLAAFTLINWYIGLAVFCFSSAQIFYMCFLGTHLESKNEQLMLEVGSFAWYALNVHDQKRAVLLLAATQTPVTLSAVMDILNVETYLKIHKTVYSFWMFLLQVKV